MLSGRAASFNHREQAVLGALICPRDPRSRSRAGGTPRLGMSRPEGYREASGRRCLDRLRVL